MHEVNQTHLSHLQNSLLYTLYNNIIMLHYIALQYRTIQHSSLHCIALQCITLHYLCINTLNFSTLRYMCNVPHLKHYIPLHCIKGIDTNMYIYIHVCVYWCIWFIHYMYCMWYKYSMHMMRIRYVIICIRRVYVLCARICMHCLV